MMIPLEIEKKFLIEQSPELDMHCDTSIDIVQIYLIRNDKNIQRRIRSMASEGLTKYYYTEKRFISAAVREENEREISAEEFNSYMNEADKELVPIIKTRKILNYENQRFEIDIYPFSDTLATMELELKSESQTIALPPFVTVLKEVTGDKEYSNAVLAVKMHFPSI
ncbi:MAG: hypothetical protein IJ368_02580 [Oscillospiraceae bacterium]|nr:hypothetical protein [Oscillospiraceae bacterium]